MSEFDYDLFVIGGGSGGVRAARIAAGYGAKVAIAEEYRYGGTCVIRGCVPKKLFMYAGAFADDFADAPAYGWDIAVNGFDWARLIQNKDKEIARLEAVYRKLLDGSGVKIYDAKAAFSDPHVVNVGGEEVRAQHILIATGGRPSVPDVPGAQWLATSNELFHLPELPKRICIVGGGFIALEFASIFMGLGCTVTILNRSERLLRGFDRQMADHVREGLIANGIHAHCDAPLERVEKTNQGYRVHAGPHIIEADLVVAATGRMPNIQGLGLEKAGVQVGSRGEVRVNEFSQTSQPHIYAVGDVTDRVGLTPIAIREGHAFADTVFGNKPTPVYHRLIPQAVFCRPQLASVGLSEEEALAEHGEVAVYESRFTPMRQTLSGRTGKAFLKLLVEPQTDEVLGISMVGPDAAEIIQSLAVALTMKAKKADFDATFALHPSAAEEFVTMRTRTRMARRAA